MTSIRLRLDYTQHGSILQVVEGQPVHVFCLPRPVKSLPALHERGSLPAKHCFASIITNAAMFSPSTIASILSLPLWV